VKDGKNSLVPICTKFISTTNSKFHNYDRSCQATMQWFISWTGKTSN
jgi:hypothetical protein